MWSTLAALFLLCGLIWFWRESLNTRELALQICRKTCECYKVQLLDETVALRKAWPVWVQGRLVLRRVYQFDYSPSSIERCTGTLVLTHRRVDSVYLEPIPKQH